MKTSTAHNLFIGWGISPPYAWDCLELDDIGLDGIQTKEDLRVILVGNAIRLIDMAVTDDSPRWSPYFTWACQILDDIPMTNDEQLLALGTAARYKAQRKGPHYLSVTRKLLKNKQPHVPGLTGSREENEPWPFAPPTDPMMKRMKKRHERVAQQKQEGLI